MDDPILNQFNNIPPLPRQSKSIFYRLALLLVSIALIVLPLLYLSLIGLIGYGIYYHATENTFLLDAIQNKTFAFLIYVGPQIAGGILILFMIKPLFAPRFRKSEPIQLSKEQEPLLFECITQLCHMIGAPVPRTIYVDLEANASASFCNFRSMLRNHLALTIGMPLVAGLNMQAFAGILAHEFGHFAQRGGMRLSYFIRSINGWFYRLAYERDAWDYYLQLISQRYNFWMLILVILLARLFIWLTRKILVLFTYIGHAISCYLLRQMEYDADSYEIHLIGSKSFEENCQLFLQLIMAQRVAWDDVEYLWETEGRLVDDYVALLMNHYGQLQPETIQQIQKHSLEERTGWWDTHPSNRDRILAARRKNTSGIFHSKISTTKLFCNFEELSKTVTREHYQKNMQASIQKEILLPIQQFLEQTQKADEQSRAMDRYFFRQFSVYRPLLLPETIENVSESPTQLQKQIETATDQMKQKVDTYANLKKEYEVLEQEFVKALLTSLLQRHKMRLDAMGAGLSLWKKNAPHQWMQEIKQKQEVIAQKMSEFETQAKTRLLSALALLHTLDAEQKETAKLKNDAKNVVSILHQLNTLHQSFMVLHQSLQNNTVLYEMWLEHSTDAKLSKALDSEMTLFRRDVINLKNKLSTIRYPFEHSGGFLSVGHFLCPEIPSTKEIFIWIELGQSLIHKLFHFYYRLYSRLAWIAEQSEGVYEVNLSSEPSLSKD